MLFNGNDLLIAMKKASLDAVEASQPSNFYFGKVTSTSPLKILVEQKITLGELQLVVPQKLTDYTMKVTFDWNTEYIPAHTHSYTGSDSDGDSCSGTAHEANEHLHRIYSEEVKEITIHNRLKVGDEVVLLKQKGGQKYLVLDKVVNL